jgi:hypothetical protein
MSNLIENVKPENLFLIKSLKATNFNKHKK